MTRKDFETVCKVLKSNMVPLGISPQADWADKMRVALAHQFCDVFELTGEARKLFLERAGVTATVTPSRN